MGALSLTSRSHPAGAPPASEVYLAVVEFMARYYDALYYGDVARPNRAFHPAATHEMVSGGELLQLDLAAYLPMVATRVSPVQRGDAYGFQLEAIEFAGPETALARWRSSLPGKRFVDFLELLKVDGEWRIAAKVFHYGVLDEVSTPVGGY